MNCGTFVVSHVIEGPVAVEDWAETRRLVLTRYTELKIVIASRSINIVALEFNKIFHNRSGCRTLFKACHKTGN